MEQTTEEDERTWKEGMEPQMPHREKEAERKKGKKECGGAAEEMQTTGEEMEREMEEREWGGSTSNSASASASSTSGQAWPRSLCMLLRPRKEVLLSLLGLGVVVATLIWARANATLLLITPSHQSIPLPNIEASFGKRLPLPRTNVIAMPQPHICEHLCVCARECARVHVCAAHYAQSVSAIIRNLLGEIVVGHLSEGETSYCSQHSSGKICRDK